VRVFWCCICFAWCRLQAVARIAIDFVSIESFKGCLQICGERFCRQILSMASALLVLHYLLQTIRRFFVASDQHQSNEHLLLFCLQTPNVFLRCKDCRQGSIPKHADCVLCDFPTIR
jgi:hypothetical protein